MGCSLCLRLKDGVVLWADGQRVDVLELLPLQVGERVERLIDLGADKAVRDVRLLAERVPAEVVAQRHERLYRYAQQHSKAVSERCCWRTGRWS